MGKRDQSFRFIENDGAYVVDIWRGHAGRRFVLSRLVVILGAAATFMLSASVIGAAAYLLFRDDLLASLLDRQTQLQYAYEDRLAALRLRLDQVTSRQYIDQNGVEGTVQSLVIRQAQLETRAAVVAQLVERTVTRDAAPFTSVAHRVDAKAPAASLPAGGSARQAAGLTALPKAPQGAVDDDVAPLSSKPQPEGMDLRLSRDPEPAYSAPPAKGRDNGGDLTPIDTSYLPRNAPASMLASAADPGVPMPTRLESLALSLDHIERDQSRRLSGIVKPALEAAGRLRRAFDVAGLQIERYAAKSGVKPLPSALGGPFIPADPKGAGALFERELATAQVAVATLDDLRRALPTTPLRKPLIGELQMTSVFGYRTDPFYGRPALHSGVDLREAYGAPVKATAAGVVTIAGPNGGYGNMVEIDHGGGMETRYAHLSAILVSPGQQIAPGAVVGRVGSTGRSTGPHLHYEVRIDGEAVDPARFLRAATTLSGITQ